MNTVKRADWVTTKSRLATGIVQRVAKDGSWADVKWRVEGQEHVKRMPTEYLIVKSSLQIGEWTVTDMTREKELKEE